MPMTVTEARRRRMAASATFVDLTPGPYLTVESLETRLPVLAIKIGGDPEREGLVLRLVAAIKDEVEKGQRYRLAIRKTV